VACMAQSWDLPAHGAEGIAKGTEGKLIISFEERLRYESKMGVTFGKDPDLATELLRTRVGMTYKPFTWLKLSGMMQDSRTPFYGPNSPNTVRDQADLHEAYVELFPDSKTGFTFRAGRMMLNYGDARLIGTPQWGNLARTYDHARAAYKIGRAQFEFLFASPVKIRLDTFNQPVLGEHVYGMYNVFSNLWREGSLDTYILRHDQNRIGGFTGGSTKLGTDRLGVTTYGGRLAVPLTTTVKFGIEGALQNGHTGAAMHRAGAGVGSITKRWMAANRPLDVSAEYKFASGTRNPAETNRESTFDQLFPANHDKFGHQDLFGWRNLHNLKSLSTYGISNAFAANFMYDSIWLASLRDSLYNGSGKSIMRSANGTAGRHVGEETDLFFTYKYKHLLFGAGAGYLFKGEFVRNTTPGVNSMYSYLFSTYSF
jgi:Alginate export